MKDKIWNRVIRWKTKVIDKALKLSSSKSGNWLSQLCHKTDRVKKQTGLCSVPWARSITSTGQWSDNDYLFTCKI